MSNENRKPKGAPTGGQFAASARAEPDVNLNGPTANPRRKVVPAPDWGGWGEGVQQVEAEVIKETRGSRTLQAVYADGRLIGHLVGRTESALSNRRWWDYKPGAEVPDSTEQAHMVFGNDSRQITIDNLISSAARKNLLR